MSSSIRVRVALALVAGCTAAAILYPVLRVIQFAKGPEPDPALIIWSEHAGYFWRSWTAGYVGGMVAFGTYVVSGRHALATARFLSGALIVATIVVTLQSLFVP